VLDDTRPRLLSSTSKCQLQLLPAWTTTTPRNHLCPPSFTQVQHQALAPRPTVQSFFPVAPPSWHMMGSSAFPFPGGMPAAMSNDAGFFLPFMPPPPSSSPAYCYNLSHPPPSVTQIRPAAMLIPRRKRSPVKPQQHNPCCPMYREHRRLAQNGRPPHDLFCLERNASRNRTKAAIKSSGVDDHVYD
jgi:hypothetical protein